MSINPKILVVDDQPENINLIKKYFTRHPYDISSALDGNSALELVKENPPDLILLDVMMPGIDGFEVCKILKNDPKTRLIPIIMVTSLDRAENRIKGIEVGVDDFLSKPVNFPELKTRVASLLKVKHYTDQLEQAEEVIFSLALAVEAKDKYTLNHCKRMVNHSTQLAKYIDLSEDSVETVRRGSYLHDIGKIAIPDRILLKPGPLESNEFDQIKKHPLIGERICQPLRTLRHVLPIVRSHHERYNGQGYPDGLSKSNIPITAQIVGLIDCYDALTSNRPYRTAMSSIESISVIKNETEEGLWETKLTSSFIELVESNGINDDLNFVNK